MVDGRRTDWDTRGSAVPLDVGSKKRTEIVVVATSIRG
jgi:hypothetical protein